MVHIFQYLYSTVNTSLGGPNHISGTAEAIVKFGVHCTRRQVLGLGWWTNP